MRGLVLMSMALCVISLVGNLSGRENKMDDDDLKMLTQYNFAEAGNQKSDVWAANTYVALNRLKSGKYGSTLSEVLQGMSSAIKTNSKQWQLATGQKKMNEYEQNVMKKILATNSAVLRGTIENNIGKSTHFENVEKFGMPKWAKKMKKVAKVGAHTYFEE